MSPIAPAGRASTKNGSAEAVCVRATYIGPALSDTINQAAPTLCINVPISETTFAVSKLRKVDDRNGRQRLVDGGLEEFGNGSHLAFTNYQQRWENAIPGFVSQSVIASYYESGIPEAPWLGIRVSPPSC